MAAPNHQQQEISSDSADGEEWAPSMRAASPVGTSPEGVRRCKVDGCGLDLTHHKTFFHRARCCPTHARELTLQLGGEAKRLCQQCSTFHLLAEFDGTKRSCRTRLESHKIRQREHHNRRVAAAAAAMQRQAAAAASAISTPPPPAAAPGVHLPDISGGQTVDAAAFPMEQQLPLGGAHLMGVAESWAPLQQRALWQQDKETMDLVAARRNALHLPRAEQQQQQQPLQNAAGSGGAPSIFADMPQDELPLAMHVGRQPSWDQPAVDVYKLSSFWEGPPPQDCPGLDAGIVSCGSDIVSIGEVDLQQPLPLIERCGSGRSTLRAGSVRSMSAEAGAPCWAGTGLAQKRGRETVLSRLGSAASHSSHILLRSSASELPRYGTSPLDMPPSYDSAHEEDRCPTFKSPFDPSYTVASAGSTGMPPVCSATHNPCVSELARPCSVKWSSLGAYDMPTRFKFASAKRASLDVVRADSASSEGCGGFRRLTGFAGKQADAYRRSSLDSRSSNTSSPSLDTPPTGIGAARSSVRRHTMAGQCDRGAQRSVKRRSLTVLPDAEVADFSPEAEDHAFADQAPEPLYLAAQLVREMGLPDRQLPQFSYGRICSASASTSTSPEATLHNADALLPPPLPGLKTGAVDEIGAAALKALLRSEDSAVLEDVSERLQRLACSIAAPRTAAPPAAMGRRIRRRSADGGAARCGMLSLVA